MPENNQPEKVDFKNVLLFKSGLFNNVKSTDEDLKSMVEFQKDHENIYSDLKIDHIDDLNQRNKEYEVFKNFPYSLAKIKNLKFKDGKLFGDYVNVFKPVKNALDDKLLTTHSAEIYYNVVSKTTGKKYKAVLSAVAILPAGKLPALMEVFKPYMYQLQTDICTNNLNKSEFENNFEFEKKLVCNLYINNKEGDPVTKEAYEKKMLKCSEMGMKTKPFVDFEKMNEDEQGVYMEMIDKGMAKVEVKKKFELEGIGQVVEQTEVKKDFALNDLVDMLKGANTSAEKETETVKAIYSMVNGIKKQSDERVNLLETQLKEINLEKKKEKVEAVLFSLIKSETPKLTPALESKARVLLMSADDSNKVSYSIDNVNLEKSSYALIVDLLDSLPENKQQFSEKSIVDANKGIHSDIKPFKSFYSLNDDNQEATHKRVVDKANEMGLSLSINDPAYIENYAMAKTSIELLG